MNNDFEKLMKVQEFDQQIRALRDSQKEKLRSNEEAMRMIEIVKNAITNQVVAKFDYDEWGKCTVVSNMGDVVKNFPFRWKGYYLDQLTGFYYIGGRWYDPDIGRFLSPDYSCLNPLQIGGLPYSLESAFGVSNPLQVPPNRHNCFPSLPLVSDESESDSSGWNLPTWARITIGAIAIIGSVALGGIPALIGVGIGAVLGVGFEMGRQAIFDGGIHDWGAVGWSTFGGAAAGGISAMVPGAGYGATFLLGGAGSVIGGTVSGGVNSFGSAALHFGIGGILNMGGKFVGDKIANGVNKLLQARGNQNLGGYFGEIFELGDMVGYAAMNQTMKSTVNYATRQIFYATGGFYNSILYMLLNQTASGILTGWYD